MNVISNIPEGKIALVYDDHQLFSSSFAIILQKTGVFSDIYTFNSENELTQFILQNPLYSPYLFCDYFVPGSNTMHLLFNVRKFCPSAKIVMVSSLTNSGIIRKILSCQVDGFIGKTDGLNQLTACLSDIANKQIFVSPSIRTILETSPSDDIFSIFSPREMEVLKHSSWGKTIEQIADALNLSKATVLTHRRNMLSKSGVHSFAQLIAQSIRAGVVPDQGCQ